MGKEFGAQDSRIGIDVVDGASVDADGGQQPGVFAYAGEIRANLAAVEEDGTPGVATFDRAFEVVPLTYPANGGRRRLRIVESGYILLLLDARYERKRAVQHTAFICADDQPVFVSTVGYGLEPETVTRRYAGAAQLGEKRVNVFPGPQHERVRIW